MKVAYFTNYYPAVSHTFIRREIAGLEAKGAEIHRFSVRRYPGELVDPDDIAEAKRTTVILDDGTLSLVQTALGVAIGRPVRFGKALLASIRMGLRSDRGLLRNLAYLLIACRLLLLLTRSGCRHLHVHFGTNPTAVAYLCGILGGPPYSFTVHGPDEFDRPWALSLTEKIEGATFIVAISSFGRSQLYRQCSLEHWPKIKIVRCGVDQGFIDANTPAIADRPRLVCVGRLCAQKGQLLLVQATARLRDAGVTLELILVGDGEMRPEIEALVREHRLEDVVKITGWASGDEVRNYLSSSRALVLPSFAEGLPVVIMEALALGRPVLTTYVAGIPELVEPNRCGWLVPAGSVDVLADAMREVLTTPVSRLTELGQEGRRRVLALHDPRTATRLLFEELKRSLESNAL